MVDCDAMLGWALVEGTQRAVTEFSHLPAGSRPQARCPSCLEPVVMKLGTLIAHHVAHRPDSTCELRSGGETALHFNAKFHLAQVLRDTPTIRGGLPILEVAGCRVGHQWLHDSRWGPTWDGVQVELALGNRRPDVVLLMEGAPVGAIEVLVHHAVDDAKADDLAALGIPWVEVHAETLVGDPRWDGQTPLRVRKMSNPISHDCPLCRASHEIMLETQRFQQMRELAEKNIREYQLPPPPKHKGLEHSYRVLRERELRLESEREAKRQTDGQTEADILAWLAELDI